MAGLFQQVAGREARDARAYNDDFLPLAAAPLLWKPVPEEIEEDIGSLLVWVAVSEWRAYSFTYQT